MNYLKKRVSQIGLILLALNSTSLLASSVSGGGMTLNINATKLADAFDWDFYPEKSSFYLEEYFDSNQATSGTRNELLSDHIVDGVEEISGIGRHFTVNGSSISGLNIANDFSFSANDLTGTASGKIGLGGAMRFIMNREFSVNAETGEERGNRTITGSYSLEYDAARINAATGHSGWVIVNHIDFKIAVFDLNNVNTLLLGDSLSLSGDLSLAEGFQHMHGQTGSIIGDFSFQTTVVPVPAAIWLFASGLAGLFVSGRTNKKVVV